MLFTLTPQAMPDGYGEAVLPLGACKAWLSIDAEVEEFDMLIEALRDASIDMVEKYTNLFLGPRTGLEARFDGFPSASGVALRVGRGPRLAVTAVSYVDGAGDAVAIEAAGWRVDARGGLLPALSASWPAAAGGVTVTFSAGFAAGECPPGLATAAKMFLAHLFANREAVVTSGAAGELPLGFRTLCDQHRMPVL